VKRGVLTEEQLQQALEQAGQQPLDRFLAQNRIVPIDVLTLTVAAYFNCEPIALPPSFQIPSDLLDIAPLQTWSRLKTVPLMKLGNP
jgi:hypothetical protein